jgi:hypothetical protein
MSGGTVKGRRTCTIAPTTAVLGGFVGIGGRHYFLRDRDWTPYYVLGGGMVWTSLEAPELDRIWNFQVVWGVGVKRITRRGACADAGVPQPPHLQRRHA